MGETLIELVDDAASRWSKMSRHFMYASAIAQELSNVLRLWKETGNRECLSLYVILFKRYTEEMEQLNG